VYREIASKYAQSGATNGIFRRPGGRHINIYPRVRVNTAWLILPRCESNSALLGRPQKSRARVKRVKTISATRTRLNVPRSSIPRAVSAGRNYDAFHGGSLILCDANDSTSPLVIRICALARAKKRATGTKRRSEPRRAPRLESAARFHCINVTRRSVNIPSIAAAILN